MYYVQYCTDFVINMYFYGKLFLIPFEKTFAESIEYDISLVKTLKKLQLFHKIRY